MLRDPARSFRHVAFLLAAAPALSACGGDAGRPDVDAGVQGGNADLEVNDPPGASLGIAFGESETLSVTYLDSRGEPSPGVEVEFRMRTDESEDTGGSTLSSASAITDEAGVADVEIVAGAESVNFRVEASAPDAPSATFFVAVSEDGFTDLVVAALHEGFRAPEELAPFQIRLYPAADYRCDDLDFDDIPPSVFPERELATLDERAEFPSRSSGAGYTVLGFSDHDEGLPPAAAGCADIAAEQVRAGANLEISLVIADRPVSLPETKRLRSHFDLGLLGEALEEAGAGAAWSALGTCSAGAGQLLLDCAQSALTGELGCRPEGEDDLVQALEAERGDPDGEGCRPAELAGEPSLDAELTEAALGGDFPGADELAAIETERRQILADLELDSELAHDAADALEHRLHAARLGTEEKTHEIDLRATARPVLVAEGIPFALDPFGGELSIGAHAFTARIGSAAAAAFRALSLEPRGLEAELEELGAALADAAEHGGETGCGAVSALACEAVDEPSDCLEDACQTGSEELGDALAEWAAFADGASIDLALSGAAPVFDRSGDLVLDAIAPEGGGSWAATLALAGEISVELVGTFSGGAPEEE